MVLLRIVNSVFCRLFFLIAFQVICYGLGRILGGPSMVARAGSIQEVKGSIQFRFRAFLLRGFRQVIGVRFRIKRGNRVVPRFVARVLRITRLQRRTSRCICGHVNAPLALFAIFSNRYVICRILRASSVLQG